MSRLRVRLSVLDQSPVGEGTGGAAALRASVEAARQAETWGYTRYWVAEHHMSPAFAGSAPEILAGALLAATSRMRIGTGGVLLPRYPALKVAEVFATLAALYPGRVDMGLGRAGGPSGDFPERVERVRSLLGPPAAEPAPVTAAACGEPAPDEGPQPWLLGASPSSGRLAGRLGTGYAFAHFLVPGPAGESLAAYRQALTARGAPARPGILAVRAVTADSEGEARELAAALLLWRSRKDLGEDLPLPSPAGVARHRWSAAQAARAAHHHEHLLYGSPEQVRHRILELAGSYGVEEVMVNTLTHDPADRSRSYRLLAAAMDLPRPALPDPGHPVPQPARAAAL